MPGLAICWLKGFIAPAAFLSLGQRRAASGISERLTKTFTVSAQANRAN
ncbi:MAG: hypothetical protein MPL62_02575 [Alphaproteobacteria bacterium]|nr:hypothetical protein [Alphaproteobacteria bacterium]